MNSSIRRAMYAGFLLAQITGMKMAFAGFTANGPSQQEKLGGKGDSNKQDELKIYTMNEVRKHYKLDDLWVVLNGLIYDLTNYVNQHPGGIDSLTTNAGQNITKTFKEMGHNEDIENVLKKYRIGQLPLKKN